MENNLFTKEITKKAAEATRWSTITEVMVRLVQPITNMILARLLSPAAFGVVATVTMITSFAEMFVDAGFQKYLVQHEFIDSKELDLHTNVAFWTNMLVSIVLWGCICFFSDDLAILLGIPTIGDVIIVASFVLPLYGFSSIQMARLKRDFMFRTLFYIRMFTAFIPMLVTIPLAFFYKSYWALVLGNLVTAVGNAGILYIYSEWKPSFYYNINTLKSMFSFSGWILVESSFVWLTGYVGVFIVGKYLSLYYLGIYRTGMTTVNQIMSLITSATSMPLFAAMSRLQNSEKDLNEVYYKYIQAIGIFVVPFGVGIWMYRYWITGILLGSQWGETADFIGLWGIMSSVSLIYGTYCNGYFNARGHTSLSFLAQVLHLVVLVPVLLIFVKQGYETLYVARSLVRFEMIFVELLLMKLCFSFGLLRLFKDTEAAFFCTVIMFIFGEFCLQYSQNIIWQSVSVLLCMMVYFGSMFFLFRNQLYSCLKILGVKR